MRILLLRLDPNTTSSSTTRIHGLVIDTHVDLVVVRIDETLRLSRTLIDVIDEAMSRVIALFEMLDRITSKSTHTYSFEIELAEEVGGDKVVCQRVGGRAQTTQAEECKRRRGSEEFHFCCRYQKMKKNDCRIEEMTGYLNNEDAGWVNERQ